MSFNDLKPIYKEFLLKLAVTLTKDELFQHSKAIMKKQKKKIMRRNSAFQIKRRKIFKGANGLRMVFRMPFGKEMRRRKKITTSFDTRTVVKEKISESTVSTSSYDLRQFKPKEPALPPPKRQRSKKAATKRSGRRRQDRASTSEDSDFLTLSNRLGCQNRNSSSGYVSCSECDSESCADRCYCSLKGDKPKSQFKGAKQTKGKSRSCKDCSARDTYDGDFSYCSCDSESCAESNKCYCAGPKLTTMQPSQSLEYLKSPSQKVYSDRLRRAFDDHCDFYKQKEGQAYRTRCSSETRRRPQLKERARSSDNLALDYELFLQNKVRDTQTRNMKRLTVRSTGAGCEDALSVKKSAEMAALFADVRLSQRTDVRAHAHTQTRTHTYIRPSSIQSRRKPSLARLFDHTPLTRNASLEDTLGYLP